MTFGWLFCKGGHPKTYCGLLLSALDGLSRVDGVAAGACKLGELLVGTDNFPSVRNLTVGLYWLRLDSMRRLASAA